MIHGKAEQPVYLWVHDGEAELRDAGHLWGRFTADVEDAIREELDDKRIHVLQCGPAAERGVLFGALVSNANRVNGRGGMGTVMASKNLKAVAVRGHKRPELADPEALQALAKWGAENVEDSGVAGFSAWGPPIVLRQQSKVGGLPTRNWSSGTFEGAEAISGERMAETILKEAGYVLCLRGALQAVVEVTEGPYQVDPRYGGPEYESLGTLGSYCGVSDLAAVAYANQLCNMYGMDTISCGATIAWAMDCFEQELLTVEDTGGIELRFGNAEALVQMVEHIGKREGFGRVLGEGSARAAETLGVGQDLVVAVKGRELPAHMPQVKRAWPCLCRQSRWRRPHSLRARSGLRRATIPERMAELGLLDPQPSNVLNAEKVRYAVYTHASTVVMDSVCVCKFVFGPAWQLYSTSQLVEAVRGITGWNVSLWELMKVGERRLNLLRAFNAREGVGIEADTVPPKLLIPAAGRRDRRRGGDRRRV